MDVILCQDVQSLGKVGDVIKVKEGYARNYLLPKKMAFLATASNLKRIELDRAKRMETARKAKEESEILAEKLAKVSCTVTVEVNDLEKLYGSVTDVDIVKALEEEGYKIEKRAIVLEKPIQELGIYEVGVKLDQGVMAKVRLWVTKK